MHVGGYSLIKFNIPHNGKKENRERWRNWDCWTRQFWQEPKWLLSPLYILFFDLLVEMAMYRKVKFESVSTTRKIWANIYRKKGVVYRWMDG
jgi:hypothetical protein